MFERLFSDLRHAARSLRRRPGYLAGSAATLALVLGANTALFSALNATWLRTVPLAGGDRIVRVFTLSPGNDDRTRSNDLHEAELLRFREASRTLVDFASYSIRERMVLAGDEPLVVKSAAVTPEMFSYVPDPLVLGRPFGRDEDLRGEKAVVLGHALWERAFGADSSVVGGVLDLDGEPHQILGVLPQSFPPHFIDAEIFTPLGIGAPVADDGSGRANLITMARLAAGATVDAADEEIAALMAGVAAERPRALSGWRAGVMDARQRLYGTLRKPFLAMLGAMLLLLLVASANVAALAMAGVTARTGELSLRRALGASRAGIGRLVLAEVALLNGLGAALGLGLARALLPLLLRIDPAATRALGPVSIDGRVIGYTAGSALLASALASVVPALAAVRGSLGATLGGATPRSGGSRARERWRSALLVIQSAVCLALLTTGGLLLQYVLRSSRVDPGFRAEGVLTAQLRLPALRYEAPEARVQLVAGLLERLSASPQVTGAATGLNDFVPGNRWVTLVRVPERPNPDGSATAVVVRRVSAGYFRTLEIPMLRGRDFDERDHAEATLAVIVSRAFSTHFWPGEDPLGRTIERGGRTFTVIGEVEDAADVDLLLAPEPTVYVTWTQSNTVDSPIALMVRTRGDPEAFVPELRQIVGEADPMLPLDRIQPLATFLSDSLAPPRFRAVIVLGLALVGLALGALGVAALTAQSVGERTAELGVRVVLGAEQRSLWRSAVLRQLGHTGWGLTLGLALSLGAARLLASLLPGIGGFDAKVALGAAAVLACTALAAAAVPASRVLHIDPARLLLR